MISLCVSRSRISQQTHSDISSWGSTENGSSTTSHWSWEARTIWRMLVLSLASWRKSTRELSMLERLMESLKSTLTTFRLIWMWCLIIETKMKMWQGRYQMIRFQTSLCSTGTFRFRSPFSISMTLQSFGLTLQNTIWNWRKWSEIW